VLLNGRNERLWTSLIARSLASRDVGAGDQEEPASVRRVLLDLSAMKPEFIRDRFPTI
jgi:aspartate oxidase